MKKVLSLFLCILMLMSAAIPAFAATTELSSEDITGLGLSLEYVGSVSKYSDKMLTEKQSKYLFKIDSSVKTADGKSDTKEYILLKSSNASADDGYFVMVQEGGLATSNDASATAQLRASYPGTSSNENDKAPTAVFDKELQSSVAYYLNSESYISTQFPIMSAGNYINDHTWYTEKTTKANAYSSVAKIALPSVTEYAANLDRIGILSNGYTSVSVLTRSAHRDGGTAKYNSNTYTTPAIWVIKSSKELGTSAVVPTYNSIERPCFYLNEDFFKNVKLDTTLLAEDGSAAAEVLKSIAAKDGGLDALKKIYSTEELVKIGIAAGNVKITSAILKGDGKLGTNLTAEATTDNTPTKTEYKWVRVNADRSAVDLEGTSNSYTVEFDDLGAEIKCQISVYDGDAVSDTKYTNAVATEAKPTFETTWNNTISNAVETTPDAYKFAIGEKEFILLKSVNSADDDGQFVMLANSYDDTSLIWYENLKLASDEKPTEFIYDPNDANSIAAKINADPLFNTLIPADMATYVNNHRWWNEPIKTTSSGDVLYQKGAFATDSRLALLSYTEYVQNADRIGYTSLHQTKNTLLRTPQFNWNGPKLGNPRVAYITLNENKIGTLDIGNVTDKTKYGSVQAKSIAFYLNPSFFAEKKVDFTAGNTEVIEILKKSLSGKTANQLMEMGYSAAEINLIFPDMKVGSVAMTKFVKNEDGSITYTFKNLTSDEVSFTPIAAAYQDGAMIDVSVSSENVTLSANESKDVTIALGSTTGAKIKVFAWNMGTLAPMGFSSNVD